MEESIISVKETIGWEQLGVLVLDGSGSMGSVGETGKTKAEEVNTAVQGLISRLKNSRKREQFYLAIVTYDHRVTTRLVPTRVPEINDNEDYNPLKGHGGETAIGDALESAVQVADQFIASRTEGIPRTAVVVLMTDGQNNRGKDPVAVAEAHKAKGTDVVICAAGYGKQEVDALTLQRIVTDMSRYVRAYDPEVLRKFFEESISQVAADA